MKEEILILQKFYTFLKNCIHLYTIKNVDKLEWQVSIKKFIFVYILILMAISIFWLIQINQPDLMTDSNSSFKFLKMGVEILSLGLLSVRWKFSSV